MSAVAATVGPAPPGGARYRSVRRLTSGTPLALVEADDGLLGRRVLLQQVDPADWPATVAALRRLPDHHPAHLARLLDIETGPGHGLVVLARPVGPTVAEVLASCGPLPGPLATQLGLDLRSALRPLHRAGLRHGSISAATVVLTPHGPQLLGVGGPVDDDHRLLAQQADQHAVGALAAAARGSRATEHAMVDLPAATWEHLLVRHEAAHRAARPVPAPHAGHARRSRGPVVPDGLVPGRPSPAGWSAGGTLQRHDALERHRRRGSLVLALALAFTAGALVASSPSAPLEPATPPLGASVVAAQPPTPTPAPPREAAPPAAAVTATTTPTDVRP